MRTEERVNEVTERIPGCLKAEQRGNDVLILRRLDRPRRRIDGKMANLELDYRWLSDPVVLTSVLGNELSYWRPGEIEGWENESLFDIFRLFP